MPAKAIKPLALHFHLIYFIFLASKKMFKFFLLLFLTKFSQCAVYNYCNQELCVKSGHKHITCGSTGDLSPSCSWDANIVELTKADRKKILHLHNKFRNRIAGGDEEGFSTATRMTTMVREVYHKFKIFS
jgi:hypothetical protein